MTEACRSCSNVMPFFRKISLHPKISCPLTKIYRHRKTKLPICSSDVSRYKIHLKQSPIYIIPPMPPYYGALSHLWYCLVSVCIYWYFLLETYSSISALLVPFGTLGYKNRVVFVSVFTMACITEIMTPFFLSKKLFLRN